MRRYLYYTIICGEYQDSDGEYSLIEAFTNEFDSYVIISPPCPLNDLFGLIRRVNPCPSLRTVVSDQEDRDGVG